MLGLKNIELIWLNIVSICGRVRGNYRDVWQSAGAGWGFALIPVPVARNEDIWVSAGL
jgi:hypothetical protein